MTTTDYRALPAGRDLDALVAERVMGLKVTAAHLAGRTQYFYDDDYGTGAAGEIVPAYSTDIAAAWQVVERLWREGRTVIVRGVSDGWIGEAMRPGDFSTLVQFGVDPRAGGPALAICRTAVAAVSADEANERGA